MTINNDGYSCFQDLNSNQIIIGLPQTWKTLNNTLTAVTTRKQALTDSEEGVLLAIVQAMFERSE